MAKKRKRSFEAWLACSRNRRTEAGCWPWAGFVDKAGYGRAGWGGKTIWAHRASWFYHGFQIPEGLEIDHVCRSRSCVNPDHLRCVTHAENMKNRTGRPRLISNAEAQRRWRARHKQA